MLCEREGSFSRVWTWLVSAIAVFAVCSTVFAAEEKRNLVFEHDRDVSYPDYEECFLNVICVDFFWCLSGDARAHFPCTLYVEYDETECYSGNDSFAVNFSTEPYDGPGLELEVEQGLKFDIDFTIYYWEYSAGKDFEEDFDPPLAGESREFIDEQVSLYDMSVTCAGGIGIGLYTKEIFEGRKAKIDLVISEPGDPNKVKFQDTGTIYTTLELTHAGETVTKFLDIDPLFVGRTIVIREDHNYTPSFHIYESASEFLPGVSAWIHKIPWDCDPWWKCRCYHEVDETVEWYIGDPIASYLEIDHDESEEIKFEFVCDNTQQPQKKSQDLVAEVKRLLDDPYPHPGPADTMIATIHNLYDSLCAYYDSINVEYSLFAGDTLVPLGVNHIDNSDPRLGDFNNGVTSEIEDTFYYEPGNPNYIFQKNTCWDTLDAYPRYVVKIHPFVNQLDLAACQAAGWTVASAAFDTSSNDLAIVAFEPPLPDFAIDSVYVGAPPYLQFGDQCTLCVRVKNMGVDWPIGGTQPHHADSVILTSRVYYERRTPLGDTATVFQELIGGVLVTPMAHSEGSTYCFEYVLPDDPGTTDYLKPYFPINVRFVFEVNGGSAPLDSMNWVVWERGFGDNTLECGLILTDMPDLALPSDTPYVDGTPITDSGMFDLPTVNLRHSCPQMRYLYVSDTSFVPYSPPPMRVEIGTGPRDTSPRETTWLWETCTFVKDFYDSDNNMYKLYKADGCSLEDLPDEPIQSYCFRASLDWTHPDSPAVYLYIDSDGASPGDSIYIYDDTLSQVNVYYFQNAGLLNTFIRGDADASGTIDLGDVLHLISYLYKGGPVPNPPAAGDANCSGVIDLGDILFLISYLYKNGPAPPC